MIHKEESLSLAPGSHEVQNNSFEQKARTLYNKLNLTEFVPQIDNVIRLSQEMCEHYHLPESFLDDEVNLSLVLGCAQKMTENTDPLYRNRPKGLAQRLIAPSAAQGTLDSNELWGSDPERNGLNENDMRIYIQSKADLEATSEFIEKHKEQIDRAKASWKARGYDLDIDVTIVADNIMEFRRKTKAGGFVNVPAKDTLSPNGGQANIDLVLLKGYSDKENFVTHELYHVEDYWGFIRRGFQGSVLEGLDELHTEYASGNYGEDRSKDPFSDSTYFTLKNFWDSITFVGDLDFNELADRPIAIESIARQFGLDGLVDFTLMYAHGSGKLSIFETFYKEHERPIMDMLIAKEKLKFRRLQEGGEDLHITVLEALNGVQNLVGHMTPPVDPYLTKYKSVYDLIPSKEGKVFSSKGQFDNNSAKKEVTSYARALAFAELHHQGEINEQDGLYGQVINTLSLIPYHRTQGNFTLEEYIEKNNKNNRSYQDIFTSLYFDLILDMRGIDFAFSLQNPTTRNQILNPFLVELDKLAKYCVHSESQDFQNWFVDGLYRYNVTSELRSVSADYLAVNFPQLKPIIEERRSSFDSRKVANFSF